MIFAKKVTFSDGLGSSTELSGGFQSSKKIEIELAPSSDGVVGSYAAFLMSA